MVAGCTPMGWFSGGWNEEVGQYKYERANIGDKELKAIQLLGYTCQALAKAIKAGEDLHAYADQASAYTL